MIFLDADIHAITANHPRLQWQAREASRVASSDPWLRSSRRAVRVLRDDDGYPFPLRDEQIWVSVSPELFAGRWRAEAEIVGSAVLGRGVTPSEAMSDWRKRFRAVVHRHLALRPFEMTSEDRDLWEKIQLVIDVQHYRTTKPMLVRQTGVIHRKREGVVVVRWADGSHEKVNPDRFDEAFSRFLIGQPFEAMVTRHPTTFRLIRAEAVRRLPPVDVQAKQRGRKLWEKVAGKAVVETTAEPIDERFWLNPQG